MKITDLKTDHKKNPIGFHMDEETVFQWKVMESCGTKMDWAKIQVAEDETFGKLLYDSGEIRDPNQGGMPIRVPLEPEKRYFWRVTVCDDTGETAVSETAFFETTRDEKHWQAKWISPANPPGGAGDNASANPSANPSGEAGDDAPVDPPADGAVEFAFAAARQIQQARLYITGLGLYEAYINGKKAGDEFFNPGFNNYDDWIQFQTFEVDNLNVGENRIRVYLGSGWYKGRYLCMGPGPDRNRYGDRTAVLAELHITYEDHTTEIIGTDENWRTIESPVQWNSLYDGELFDGTCQERETGGVQILELGYDRLTARYSLPVRVMEEISPVTVIHTKKGETVLDFGQNLTGFMTFYNRLPAGEQCSLQAGEILQDECFYRENYRTAQSQFIYISSGKEEWVRPRFSYYGFRYLKLEGFGEKIRPEDFKALVLYSDMEQTGEIKTGNKKVNQLVSNIIWGQKGNFLDVPTDCPQRDERLGWTGDAQVFSMTASYNMDTAAFFRKFMKDLYSEQKKNKGSVPFTVPNICFGANTSAGWGDAAAIIPWNLYLMYGDKKLLSEQYDGMKAWVGYIRERDEAYGKKRLWDADNHFGDWLALDDPGVGTPTGGTDLTMIATGYYYLSAKITAKAAGTLGYKEEEEEYKNLAEEIAEAYRQEFFTPSGRLAEGTQTAYAFTLYLGLALPGKEDRLVDGLVQKLKESGYHLKTGFVGTTFLCPMLSRYGRNDLAYRLLLNEDYPGWLYCVNLGATTIWERWNSVLPDGKMNPEGMNSLNHYAYGSIAQWMYQYMLGIKPDEAEPGWRHFYLEPMPDSRIGFAAGHFDSCQGRIVSRWRYEENGTLSFHFEIPFGTAAAVTLHDTEAEQMELAAGVYDFCYPALSRIRKKFTKDTPVAELLADEQAKEILGRMAPDLLFLPPQFASQSLEESIGNVFGSHSLAELSEIVAELKKI